MILAAGLGTRLKPLTDKIPKALVEIDGIPMIERVIQKLKKEGFSQIVVNVHHFSSMVQDFIRNRNFGVEISISDESDMLLDTGGGIVKASSMLFKDDEPVLIHNVDIISNADLKGLITKNKNDEGVTLLVSDRTSNRKLIFDQEMILSGWHDLKNNIYRNLPENKHYRNRSGSLETNELAFSGIYAINKNSAIEMRDLLGQGKFSVMEYFLHPERKNEVRGFKQDNLKLIDIGKPATLEQASDILKEIS